MGRGLNSEGPSCHRSYAVACGPPATTPQIVIPAKAGIQSGEQRRALIA